MCGRSTLVHPETAADRFRIVDFHDARIVPRCNIAPSQPVLTVAGRDERPAGQVMRWGFRPEWMTAPKLPPPINAKAESLLEKPMWRGALARARCLIPADGFYEWRAVPGQKAKQPVYIRLQDGGLFAFAGLYAQDPDGTPTCAIITTTANELMAPIHARMPVILARADEALWLDPAVRDPLALVPVLRRGAPIRGEAPAPVAWPGPVFRRLIGRPCHRAHTLSRSTNTTFRRRKACPSPDRSATASASA